MTDHGRATAPMPEAHGVMPDLTLQELPLTTGVLLRGVELTTHGITTMEEDLLHLVMTTRAHEVLGLHQATTLIPTSVQ